MAATHAETITESSILTSYLLPPSPLPSLLPYGEFLKTCVPAQHRSHPLLKRLYRDLQFQRNIDIDSVRQNIERETIVKAPGLRARLARAIAEENGISKRDLTKNGSKKRKRGDNAEIDLELKDDSSDNEFTNVLVRSLDQAYESSTQHPSVSGTARSNTICSVNDTRKTRMHTTTSLMDAMDSAVSSLEREMAELNEQSNNMFSQMQETIGGLSDLRYGKFARVSTGDRGLEQGIIDAMKDLQETCMKLRERDAQGENRNSNLTVR